MNATLSSARHKALFAILIVIIGFAAVLGSWAVSNHFPNSDEATTVIASRGVLQTGLPRLPSGLNYWRSPLSHYLNAVSFFVGGNSYWGWRGISFAAFMILVLALARACVRWGSLALAPVVIAAIVGHDYFIEYVGSARMYMLLSSLIFIAWLVYADVRRSRPGLFAALLILAALSHQYTALFGAGVLAHQGWRWVRRAGIEWAYSSAAIAAIALSIVLHFTENFLPNAFGNFSSEPAPFMRMSSLWRPVAEPFFIDPLRLGILGTVLAVVSWIGVAAEGLRSIPWARLTVPVAVFGLVIGLSLPSHAAQYFVPWIPFVHFLSGAVLLAAANWLPRPARRWLDPRILLLCIVWIPYARWKPSPDDTPRLELRQLPALRAALENFVGVSTDPEIHALLIGEPLHEVRTRNVGATAACETRIDDQFGNSYIHDPCTLDAFLAQHRDRGIVVTGHRLNGPTVSDELNAKINADFRLLTYDRNFQIYCRDGTNADCENVCRALAAACPKREALR